MTVVGNKESDKQVRVKTYTYWFASSPEMDHAQAHLQLMRGIAQVLADDRAIGLGDVNITKAQLVVPMTWVDDEGTAHIIENIIMHRAEIEGIVDGNGRVQD